MRATSIGLKYWTLREITSSRLLIAIQGTDVHYLLKHVEFETDPVENCIASYTSKGSETK